MNAILRFAADARAEAAMIPADSETLAFEDPRHGIALLHRSDVDDARPSVSRSRRTRRCCFAISVAV